ncbi:zona pellucida sperm-binding protein 4-like [Acipenser ruthenus]|uniref:zona pellucida sperm-binding protein 4-like n=1 Tax=Acipenser ruthenus TaxID=7906 RepID=UPI0027409D49|nr:zona pellucida sperm-binding protein 4-like [Acipenser ruthenus]
MTGACGFIRLLNAGLLGLILSVGCRADSFLQTDSDLYVKSLKTAEPVSPDVSCTETGIQAVFYQGIRSKIKVVDLLGEAVKVNNVQSACQTEAMTQADGTVTFRTAYDGCYVRKDADSFVVILEVRLITGGPPLRIHISCPIFLMDSPVSADGCNTPSELQVACGPQGVSPTACHNLGCCFNHEETSCYYRLNECTRDGQFIFLVRQTDTVPALRLDTVEVKGQGSCAPVVNTGTALVFMFPVTECGARRTETSGELVYMVEVTAEPEIETGGFGPVTRDSYLRLQLQCRYSHSEMETRTMSVLDLPPQQPATSFGNVTVEMRVAKDSSFTRFFPSSSLPLTRSLRDPIFVEVRILPPASPALSLILRDCFAYPSSQQSLWMLLYDGCPNYMDPFRSTLLRVNSIDQPSHYQRFNVKAFTFIDLQTGGASEEEMYFYCWVEVCNRDSESCVSKCLPDSNPSPRTGNVSLTKRELVSDPDTALVSLGPIVLVQTEATVQSRGQTEAPKYSTVSAFLSFYSLSAVCSAAVFFLVFSAAAAVLCRGARKGRGLADRVAVETET